MAKVKSQRNCINCFFFVVSVEGAARFRLSYVDLLKDSKRHENLETLG